MKNIKIKSKFLVCLGVCISVLTLSSCNNSVFKSGPDEDELIRSMEDKKLFAYGIGKINSSAADAMARQPAIANKLQYIKDNAINSIIDNKVSGLKSACIGKLVGQELDACARQPEMLNKLQYGADIARHSILKVTTTDDHAFAIGKFSGSYCDAAARQPEIYGKLTGELVSLIDRVVKNDSKLAIGYAYHGSLFDAMARQPECFNMLKYTEWSLVSSSILISDSSEKAMAIGYAASGIYDAMARQPEAMPQLYNALKTTIDNILRY